MRAYHSKLGVVVVISTIMLCSCAHIESDRTGQTVELPANYSLADSVSDYPRRWWEAFADAQLNEIVAEALAGNPGLRQAAARLEQAQAVARQAGAAQSPDLSIEGSAGRGRSSIRSQAGPTFTTTRNQFGLGLAASYELDLWGRIGATKRAAMLDFQASRYDLEAAAITLVAQVSELWYTLGARSEQLRLLEGQIESSKRQADLIELRFSTGQATALDVWQQRGQVAALESIRPQLESALVVARNRLAILLGRTPQSGSELQGGRLPLLPDRPATGVPLDLLRNRPDLGAALERVRAADERVGAAVAKRFPALRISTTAGYSAEDTARLFDDWIWNVVGNLVAPLIDGGSRRAEVERTRAVLAERISQYTQGLLTAVAEVEDALAEERKQAELIVSQSRQLDIAEQTLNQAGSRYAKGLSDYLSVLQALQSKQALERTLVDSRRQLLVHRIQLYRALGADFSDEVKEAIFNGESQ